MATFIMGVFGNRAVLGAIAVVSVLNIAITASMFAGRFGAHAELAVAADEDRPTPGLAVAAILVAFSHCERAGACR